MDRISESKRHGLRSRPDQGHFSAENVDQLRELVETGQPEDCAKPRDALVARRCNLGTVEAAAHAAKFVHGERDAPLSHTNLSVNRRSMRADARCGGNHQQQWPREAEGEQRNDDVQGSSLAAGVNSVKPLDHRLWNLARSEE